MLSNRFFQFAALVSVALANPLLGDVHRRQSDVPEGFTAVGLTPEEEIITFRIALTHKDFPELEKALYAASTPGGAQYGQYLTKAQVNAYAAPSEEAIKSVLSWLESQGLTPSSPSPSGGWISVKATVGQANRLLQADFKTYNSAVHSRVIRTLSYDIPEAVKPHVAAIHPTTIFPPSGTQRIPAVRNFTSTGAEAKQGSVDFLPRAATNIPESCKLGPGSSPWDTPWSLSCRFDLYDIPYTTVGSPASANSLWTSGFRNNFANRNKTTEFLATWRPELIDRKMFRFVTLAGGINNQLPVGYDWLFKTYGVALAMSVTPNTPITFMSVGIENSIEPIDWFIDQANYLLELEDPPKVFVGEVPAQESETDRAVAISLCNTYAQLAARGVTIVFPVNNLGVGSGWQGDSCAKFDVSFPSSCPYVTAVGGAELYGNSVSEEVAPRNSGGFSTIFPRPVYQNVVVPDYLDSLEVGIYEGMFDPSGRGTPDLVLQNSVAIAPGPDSTVIVSTTYPAELLGAMVALLNEELILAGKPTLGFLNPLIYQNVDAFNDFTSGNNPGCATPGFNATAGWDPVSGIGSPMYSKLRKAAGL